MSVSVLQPAHHIGMKPTARLVLLALAAGMLSAGCCFEVPPPDQTPFAPLETLRDDPAAVVRLYAAPFVPCLDMIATHYWFVVKLPDSTEFHRWEVGLDYVPPYGHVMYDVFEPEQWDWPDKVYIVAELIGPDAEPVAEFIQNQTLNYPAKDCYLLYPGPNSNTYIQWVFDNTGWQVELPSNAIGQYVPVECPAGDQSGGSTLDGFPPP